MKTVQFLKRKQPLQMCLQWIMIKKKKKISQRGKPEPREKMRTMFFQEKKNQGLQLGLSKEFTPLLELKVFTIPLSRI